MLFFVSLQVMPPKSQKSRENLQKTKKNCDELQYLSMRNSVIV